jgi:signal transduction histidine kinase
LAGGYSNWRLALGGWRSAPRRPLSAKRRPPRAQSTNRSDRRNAVSAMLQANEPDPVLSPRARRGALYALPFVAVGAAFLLNILFRDQLQPHRYAPFLFAIIIIAFVGGFGPALVGTAVAVVATNYFDYLVLGKVQLDADDFVQLVIFTTIAVSISFLTTRRKRAERALKQANAELRELDRAKDKFIATVSHELRTPMTVILGWAAILRQENDDQLRTTAAAAIEQSARAQSQLIEHMLDMSRITLGKLHLEVGTVGMATIIQQSVDMIRPEAEAKRIVVRVTLPHDPCVIQGDQLRLQQICWNLLSNAVKFTPEGGHVDVRLSRDDEAVEISISDDGDGIPGDLLPRIFEPFRQGNGSTAKGGLGLGLAIVKELVTMHHGTIEARSDGAGNGARFIVRLPVAGRIILTGAELSR